MHRVERACRAVVMFRNLYFQSPAFREFNFTDCLGRIAPVSEDFLRRGIVAAYDGEPFEPCYIDTVALSLRLETAERYLRARPHLSLVPRDFLLSKLFEFLYLTLRLQNQLDRRDAPPLRRKLESWLDQLDETALRQLHRFDWLGFFDDTNRLDRPTLLRNLHRYLPARKGRQQRQPGMGRRGPVPNLASYQVIAWVIQRVGPDWTRRAPLVDVAVELDHQDVPTPRAWEQLTPAATSWRSAVDAHPKRVVKILKYRLKYLRQHLRSQVWNK